MALPIMVMRMRQSAVTYNPVAGSYTAPDDITSSSITLTCSESATWTWSRTSGLGDGSIASGGSGTSITFGVVQGPLGSGRSGHFSVDAMSVSGTAAHFEIDVACSGDGGG